MKIPIIILNYNSSADCCKCIGFLKRQQGVEIEIVVVDNCSPREGEQDAIKQLCAEDGCTFIQANENRGYNAGNNIGLRYAAKKGYKYAMIANPDMEFPQTDYVWKLVEPMEKNDNIVVVGSDIVSPEGIHQNPMLRDCNWHNSFNWINGILKNLKNKDSQETDYKESHYCIKVSGCCLLLKMDFLKSIGFFDENVFLFCEEAILSRQVENAGKRMYYISETQAIHRHIKNEKGNPSKRFKYWKQSRIYFIKKYSSDNFLGKWISILSTTMYAILMILLNDTKCKASNYNLHHCGK